jgi:glycine/D-amino acid oxidase-like deaminating enzyme
LVNAYEGIVIGGGHSGLVAGAYLAKSGARAGTPTTRVKQILGDRKLKRSGAKIAGYS